MTVEKFEQIFQIKKLLNHLDNGTNVDAGGCYENQTDNYINQELAQREWKTFFCDTPQLIGLSGDLPKEYSFLTMRELGTPILAVRDGNGKFRAFVNSCRHRGVVVEEEERGLSKRFTCQFHRWTYDVNGTLVGLPKSEHFGQIETKDMGLVELPSEERYGLLWVHPNPDGEINLETLLTEKLLSELEQWKLNELDFLGEDTYDVACNWKFAMDTFGETYHFSSLHENTLSLAFHGNVQCYDTFGNNHRMLLCRREIDEMRKLPESQWEITMAALPVYWLFPNVQLMPYKEGLYLVRAYPNPSKPGFHCSRITFYLRPEFSADTEMKEVFTMISQRFAEIIRDEDYAVGESQQITANSKALKTVLFGRNEPALHHYHSTYKRVLDLATT